MDASEALVEQYLHSLGHTKVVYEPNGNVPPDFLVDDRIAVEVRRLNLNVTDGNKVKGLEETAIPLAKIMAKELESFGAPTYGQSWYVFYRFSRPLNINILKPKIHSALLPYQKEGAQPADIKIDDGFSLKIFRKGDVAATLFVKTGQSDQQSGGFILDQVLENLAHCINEKSNKISNYRSQYNEWWLAFPDHIGVDLMDHEELEMRRRAPTGHGFSKIIILDVYNPKRTWLL